MAVAAESALRWAGMTLIGDPSPVLLRGMDGSEVSKLVIPLPRHRRVEVA